MSARTKLSTLRAQIGNARLHTERRTVNAGASNVYDVLDFIVTVPSDQGDDWTIFSVNIDDLFDADGNSFEDDQ